VHPDVLIVEPGAFRTALFGDRFRRMRRRTRMATFVPGQTIASRSTDLPPGRIREFRWLLISRAVGA